MWLWSRKPSSTLSTSWWFSACVWVCLVMLSSSWIKCYLKLLTIAQSLNPMSHSGKIRSKNLLSTQFSTSTWLAWVSSITRLSPSTQLVGWSTFTSFWRHSSLRSCSSTCWLLLCQRLSRESLRPKKGQPWWRELISMLTSCGESAWVKILRAWDTSTLWNQMTRQVKTLLLLSNRAKRRSLTWLRPMIARTIRKLHIFSPKCKVSCNHITRWSARSKSPWTRCSKTSMVNLIFCLREWND